MHSKYKWICTLDAMDFFSNPVGAVLRKRCNSDTYKSTKHPSKKANSKTGLGALADVGNYTSSSEGE